MVGRLSIVVCKNNLNLPQENNQHKMIETIVYGIEHVFKNLFRKRAIPIYL